MKFCFLATIEICIKQIYSPTIKVVIPALQAVAKDSESMGK